MHLRFSFSFFFVMLRTLGSCSKAKMDLPGNLIRGRTGLVGNSIVNHPFPVQYVGLVSADVAWFQWLCGQ